MLHHGYWLFEFVSISQAILRHRKKYDLSYLYSESDENDLSYFLLFQMEVIEEAMQSLRKYLAEKSAELRKAERELKALSQFNFRQKAMITHALHHSSRDYTIQGHRESHNVTYETARTDLLELEEAGLFEKLKKGKAFVFKPVPKLSELLRKREANLLISEYLPNSQ